MHEVCIPQEYLESGTATVNKEEEADTRIIARD